MSTTITSRRAPATTWLEWASGHDQLDPVWTTLTRAPSMTLVIGLENALRPIAAPFGYDALDRSAVRMLESLIQTGAEVVIVSARARAVIEVLVRAVMGARWVADAGLWRYDGAWTCAEESLDAWIRRRLPAGPLLAIGDGLPIERFRTIAPFEIAVSVGAHEPHGVRRRLSGTTSVRAFLWWLIENRTENLGITRADGRDV